MGFIDIIGSLLFLVFSFFVYKKAWFYSFYSFVRFLLISAASFFSGLYISSHIPYPLPITALQTALIIQLVIFVVLWKVFSFKHIFFATARKVFNIDRFIFTHHLDRLISIFPSIIASFFITFFIFTSAVSFTPKSSFLSAEIEKSSVVRPIFYSVYFYPTKINLAFFNGTVFKITPPASFASGEVNLSQIKDSALLAFREKLDVERIKKNLYTLPAFEKINPEDEMFRKKRENTPAPYNPPNTSTTSPSTPNSPTPIPNPYVYYYPTATPYVAPPTNPSVPYIPDPTATPYVSAPTVIPEPPTSTDTNQVEQEIFNLTNEERQKNGVSPLTFSNEIAAVARAHSQDMNDRNFFSHNNPDGLDPFQRMRIGGISFSTAGENIAGGQSASIMMTNWMNSPGHRANILNPAFHKIGVGVATNGKYGLLATQDFTN